MASVTRRTIYQKGRSDPASLRGISPEARRHMIGEAAYYRYTQRGFAPGHDVEDWLAAEADFERASYRQPPSEPDDTLEEFGMQQGGALGPAEDEALKRMIKQHPRRDIPRMESMEPEDAPLKE